jgi:RNA polymerase sigma factor (sigma-70 family)
MTRVSNERALWLARNLLPHEPALRAWLAGKRLRGVDLDDIVQETYAILAGLESVAAIRNPRAYMFQTAYSVILAQIRRAQIVSISTVEDIDRLAGEDGAPSPETEAGDREAFRHLAEGIAGLPPRCREVFVLRKIDGLSQREVAQKLGVSEGTIEKQMHKGLNLLMSVLGRGGTAPREASHSRMDRGDAGTKTHGPTGNSRGNR